MIRLQALILVTWLASAPRTAAFSPRIRTNGNGYSNVIRYYADSDTPPPSIDIPRKSRHRPRRALPHIQTSSSDEAASKAGYIIRRGVTDERTPQRQRNRDINNSRQERRPLRTIRRAVHRSEGSTSQISNKTLEQTQNQQQVQGAGKQIREGRDERVTFKATREASHSISKFALGQVQTKGATLTDYMTQPVEDYSLLSFHDEEDPSSSNGQKETTSRRWFVRRLTHEEASKYIVDPSCSAVKEFNLFRLAVPLQPLIGWDLTPVIDLEVIPPEISHEEPTSFDDNGPSSQISQEEGGNDSDSRKWRPLRGIRSRVDGSREENTRPTVKIRSMSVSLLSTKEEVRLLMKSPGGRQTITAKDKEMQSEAIGMVGKVEEWLKPHITFEAELAWQDETVTSKASVVSVKSSAVTSLTIPRIQNDIIRATVPSAFLVKRLGATLTSKALEICLPRFLRQLERDYYRWSGIE